MISDKKIFYVVHLPNLGLSLMPYMTITPQHKTNKNYAIYPNSQYVAATSKKLLIQNICQIWIKSNHWDMMSKTRKILGKLCQGYHVLLK